MKASGLGREGGQHSLDFYTETSIVHVASRRHPRPSIRSHVTMSSTAPPNIVRAAYAELIVTDLDAARWFWVDMLGFHVHRRG